MQINQLEITTEITSEKEQELRQIINQNLDKIQGVSIVCIANTYSFLGGISTIRRVLSVLNEFLEKINIKYALVCNEDIEETDYVKSVVKLYDNNPVLNENIFM